MDNLPSLGDRLRALPKALSVSVIIVFCLAVLGGTGYWGSQYYHSRTETATLDDLGRFIKEGVTVNNCDEMQKYQISRWSRPEKIAGILSTYNEVKNGCSLIKADFGSISFFDPEHDFRSTLSLSFSVPIDQILGKAGSEEYKKNELMAKEKMLSQIHFSPEVKMTSDDIALYGNKVILSLLLEPKKNYTLLLENSVLTSTGTRVSSWEFTTPENKTFLLRTTEKASLYSTLHPPVVELLAYDTEKSNTKIKVCGLDLENYGKIEVLLKNNDIAGTQGTDMISGEVAIPTGKLSFRKEFFRSGIDAIKNTGCQEIPVPIIGDAGENTLLIKKEIPLEETLKKLGNTGLFMVVFTDIQDRDYNGRIQPPLLFGTINAHTTMKVSQNGEAFFFVNDFAGQPLENIEMSVNINEFRSKETTYANGQNTVIQHSPLDKSVYSKAISLGKTNKDGILKTNLKGKINDYFGKTFENRYEFDESGTYPSFFVTGSAANTLSYVSSQWNGGIAPWNFGYSINSWFDSSVNLNGSNLSVNQWIGDDLPFVAHIFTDRVLYLPGETVSIKAIIRNSLDLSSPKNGKFNLVIRDDQGKEVKRTPLLANEFGSVLDTFVLDKEIPLGAYTVVLFSSDDREIGWTNFSIEVFKNPKFTTDITLTTVGMDGENVTIASKGLEQKYMNTEYRGKFTLNAQLIGRYYSGGTLGNVPFDYKVYRQEYYDNTYWNDCYYGCYWEPNKEFYTEGSAVFDANGGASLSIPVDFTSLYSDYRYIVEVTPRDTTGDVVSSTNSIIARLPAEYKRWDPNTSILFQTENRFYPANTPVHIQGKLNHGKWDESHENKYLLIVKKKSFEVTEVADVRGFKRPISTPTEELVEVIPVSKNRFQIGTDGTLSIDYTLPETAEYIFEFGAVDAQKLQFDNLTPEELIKEFNMTKSISLNKKVSVKVDDATDFWALSNRCTDGEEVCSRDALVKSTGCNIVSGEICLQKGHFITMNQKIAVSDLIMGRQFFSLLTYSDTPGKNPVISDNKIQVLSEKVSYKIGEKARVLIRLPFTNGKILWTVEKRGVEKSEYIDVPGNVFFKEVTVDESFTPNAYISVLAIDTSTEKIPEYKVGYTEIVVDKTDKKSSVTISADKKIYAPREKVTLSMQVKDTGNRGKKSELTVMVIDDSLISLMGNIDTNTLEKIWKKLPFQMQTSITNIAMLKNYYFARPGIVGGSGAGNNKGGDSAKSTRTIFKNTAYYNGHVVTDADGMAKVDFILPDNLTQFRVIVLSNSLDNTFGSGETIFSVQKPVTLEDKTPLILRDNDHIILGANLFNQTGKDMSFTVVISSNQLTIQQKQKKITLKNGTNTFVTFDVKNQKNTSDIIYTMTASGDSPRNSDSLEGHITVAQSPTLIQRVTRDDILSNATRDYTVSMPENTLLEKSTYEVSLSNNPIQHLESILSSLLIYPYGCIEQSTSTTVPNVMAQKFAQYFSNTDIDLKKAEEQTKVGLARIASMQTESGGFAYWEGSNDADLHITPYVLRSLLTMRDMGAPVDQMMIDRATSYLLASLPNAQDNTAKVEIFFALARAGKGKIAYDTYFGNTNLNKDLTRHERVAYTYALILTDKAAYASSIKDNIVAIKNIFEKPVTNENYWYWDETSDKAMFTSLLMDMNYDVSYITSLIKELSDKDYMSYYISTQSKNATFGAFIQYIEKYGKNQKTPVQVTINNKAQNITLTGDGGRFISNSPLAEVIKNGKVTLSVKNDSKTPVFVSVRLNAYPADIKKVKKYENGIVLSRTIQEVIDTKKLAECSGYYYYDNGKNCDSAFKTIDGDVFKKGATYKITLKAVFTDDQGTSFARRNMTLEDYLPATFRVMNSKFRTNSIATNQNTTQGWYYNHVEVLPNLIMAYAENIWGDTAEYSYFVIPEFEGSFTYPPATAYLMYSPDIRAYGEFRTIEVK